jgi:hypothetical protein
VRVRVAFEFVNLGGERKEPLVRVYFLNSSHNKNGL